jgi:hypothetical protein
LPIRSSTDPLFVHPAGVEIADLLPDRARSGRVPGHVLDDRADILVELVIEHRIDADKGPVGGDLGALGPGSVDIVEEVVARLDATVHGGEVDAPRREPRLRLLGKRRRTNQRRYGGQQQQFPFHGNPLS